MYSARPHPIALTLACQTCAGIVRAPVAAPARPRVPHGVRWGRVCDVTGSATGSGIGLIPLGRYDLARARPELVPSVDTAKQVLKFVRKAGLEPKSPDFAYYVYRKAFARGSDAMVAVSVAQFPTAKAVHKGLEAALGPVVKLLACEAPAPRPATQPASPALRQARLTLTLGRVQPAPATIPASPRPRPWQAVGQPRTAAPPPRPIRGPDSQATPRLRAPTPPSDTTAGRIGELSRAVRNLTISWQNPWRYYEERSSIAAELASLARTLGAAA